MRRVGDLQIEEAPTFQRRMWVAERVGWALLALALLAALLGLAGNGPLSTATVAGGSLAAEYDRFGRLQAPTELRLRLGPGAAKDGEARVWLSGDYLAAVSIERITPPPVRAEAGPDGQTFVFALVESGGEVVFALRPDTWGPLRGAVRVGAESPLAFRQYVYP